MNESLKKAFAPGVAAVRAHWRPLLFIQVAALLLVVAYYQSPAVREVASDIAALKQRGGLLFAFCGGFLAGWAFPEIAKFLTGQLKVFDAEWLKKSLFTGLVYGLLASQVDVFYQLQAMWFGTGVSPGTILIKTFVDMGIVAPLWFVPFTVAFFEGRRAGFGAAISVWRWPVYRRKVVPALLPNWAFWIPVLFCVYALPTNLQLPLSILAEAAWSIVFVFIATDAAQQN